MSSKPSNPKDVIGSDKVPLSLIPVSVLTELALALGEGGLKYGVHNYLTLGVRSSIYIDATLRHLFSYQAGEDLDPDSDLSHITKAIASLVVLRAAMIHGLVTDDRPPPSPPGMMQDANSAFYNLKRRYAHLSPDHYDRESIKSRTLTPQSPFENDNHRNP